MMNKNLTPAFETTIILSNTICNQHVTTYEAVNKIFKRPSEKNQTYHIFKTRFIINMTPVNINGNLVCSILTSTHN